MSFGGPMVQGHGHTVQYPTLSMITGLLGNALGYDRSEYNLLQSLQRRVRFAARSDRPGELINDFQTVNLDQYYMKKVRTTRGYVDKRTGATSNEIHIRNRYYYADAMYTVSFTLDPLDNDPDLFVLKNALRYPKRPLFIGRKCCIPSVPIFLRYLEAKSPLDALKKVPRVPSERSGVGDKELLLAWWYREDLSSNEEQPAAYQSILVTDSKDWRNQIHCGTRELCSGSINPPKEN
jgi:CRISPR system Cascade subunit CasD